MDLEDTLSGVSDTEKDDVRSLLQEVWAAVTPHTQKGAGGFPGARGGRSGSYCSPSPELLFGMANKSGDGGGERCTAS